MNAKIDRLAIAAVLAASLAACAHDRTQDVKSAETELTGDEQKARDNQAALDRKQANEQTKAYDKGLNRDDHAELDAKQRSERAEQRADDQKDISASQTNVVDKSAALEQERRDFETKAKERMTKIDAKAKEMKTKSTKLTAQKKADFTSNWQKYTMQRSDVDAKVGGIVRASNDSWNGTKSTVETSLDSLEETVDKLGKDL